MHIFWTALCGTLALLWLVGALRVYYGMSHLPHLGDVSPLPDAGCPSVSILVAARDEATAIRKALSSLLMQDYPRYELIVVDDRSRDATAEILDELARGHDNVKVIHVAQLPPGWLGKPHALAMAYHQAVGEWLVFTDADVRFAPDVLRRLMALAKDEEWEHLNVLPHLELVGFWEKTVLGFWAFSSILWLQPWRVSDRHSRRYFGFGALQCLRRSAYELTGTHRRLAMEVVDDIELGKLAKQAGLPSGVAIGGDKVCLRYLEGLGNIIRSVSKSAFAACSYRVSVAIGGALASILLYLAPFIAVPLATGIGRALASVAVLCILVLYARGLSAERVSSLYAPTLPLGATIMSYILLHSMIETLWHGGITWRNTFYPLQELRKARELRFRGGQQ